jgi:hypothetical protein
MDSMRKWFMAAAMFAALPTFAVEGDFHWTGALNPGQTLEIKGVNGGIRAEYASGTQVQVDARKTARRSDISGVRVEVVPHAGGVTICSVYPGDGSRPNECRPGNEGRMNNRDNDVKVDFTVRVPLGVRLVAKTVNGDVIATALQSEVEARTVNGKIEVASTGLVRASTVNGSIEAAMGTGTWSGELNFSTVNGSVVLAMPPTVSADIKATTVNGAISSDFPLTVSGKFGPKSISGRIGNGGQPLRISTVNGGITLRSSTGRTI